MLIRMILLDPKPVQLPVHPDANADLDFSETMTVRQFYLSIPDHDEVKEAIWS